MTPSIASKDIGSTMTSQEIQRLREEWQALEKACGGLPAMTTLDLRSHWCAANCAQLELLESGDFVFKHFGEGMLRVAGQTLAERAISSLDDELGKFFQEDYRAVLENGSPMRTSHRDPGAQIENSWERLVLPFGDAKGEARYLLVFDRPMDFAVELLIGLMDASSDSIIALKAQEGGNGPFDLTVELVNRNAEEVLGIDAAEAQNKSLRDLLPKLVDREFWRRCVASYEDAYRQTVDVESLLMGEAKTFRATLSPMARGLLLTFSDITELVRRDAILSAVNKQLEEMAYTDPLTDLANERHFMQAANLEYRRSKRYSGGLSMVMVDIDNFNSINDKHGHAIGDEVLKAVAGRMKRQLREHDLVGRLGGEEFGLLLPETPITAAIKLAERVRQAICRDPIRSKVGYLPVTISLGVAETQRHDRAIDDAMRRADDLLYRAKREGRNRVCAPTAQAQKQRRSA